LVVHEYAHAAIHDLSRGRAPRWLHEGLAQVLEGATSDPMLQIPGGLTLAGVEALAGEPDPLRARAGYDIALWIVRDLLERGGLGIRSVLAHSKADAHSLPMKLADETICVGPDAARLSYLNIPAIISAAAVTDSEAIHPGYGFLAENPAFAEVCRACSITFIGPSPEAIRLMGDKAQARQIAMQAGVPVIPGSEVALKGSAEALEVADRIGYPIMFKAAAGGGGRGMRIVRERGEVVQAFDACQSEAGAAFGSSEVYCEKFVQNARHVEVQVLGDRNGIRVHLGERDCSVQRRHQKLLEESPAPL